MFSKLIKMMLTLFLFFSFTSSLYAENANRGMLASSDVPENKKYVSKRSDSGRKEGTNRGVVILSDVPENKKYVAVDWKTKRAEEGADVSAGEAVRSGIAGTFAMWGKLIANALPSNEALPNKKKAAK